MDGVLVDNHESWSIFDTNFLAELGIKSDKEYKAFVNGRSMEEVALWTKEHYQLSQNVEDILVSKQSGVKHVYEVESKPMFGVEDLLKKIKKSNLKLALCSGAKMWMIETILDRFNWQDYFEVVVSSDHVECQGKPDPEIYLYTSKLLNIDPKSCVVIEDAENGVKSAIGAGMECVGYVDLRFELSEDLSRTKFNVNSFSDKKLIEFLNI